MPAAQTACISVSARPASQGPAPPMDWKKPQSACASAESCRPVISVASPGPGRLSQSPRESRTRHEASTSRNVHASSWENSGPKAPCRCCRTGPRYACNGPARPLPVPGSSGSPLRQNLRQEVEATSAAAQSKASTSTPKRLSSASRPHSWGSASSPRPSWASCVSVRGKCTSSLHWSRSAGTWLHKLQTVQSQRRVPGCGSLVRRHSRCASGCVAMSHAQSASCSWCSMNLAMRCELRRNARPSWGSQKRQERRSMKRSTVSEQRGRAGTSDTVPSSSTSICNMLLRRFSPARNASCAARASQAV
mmetsp:Transcript_3665/g.10671  ORF Transcript_3665/g.10671 Transcript_3665/m.10671 type:complete len:306 (+) Transcript_3665:1004-1921(+)